MRHAGKNLVRAGLLVLLPGGAAHKNPRAAGRIAGTRNVIRTGNRHPRRLRRIVTLRNFKALHLHAIQAQIQLGHRQRSPAGARRPCRGSSRTPPPSGKRHLGFRRFPQERHANGPQPRSHRLADFQLPVAAALSHLHADHVLRIHREVVAQHKASARIEGKIVAGPFVALGPAAPRTIPPPGKIFHRRLDTRVADRQAAHQPRGRHVLFKQCGRHRKHVADIVEPVARIVHRQRRPRLDIERQYVANRIAVLHAIQAMHGGPAGIRIAGGRMVQRLLQRFGERRRHGRRRTRHPGGRHLSRAELTQDAFQQRRVAGYMIEVDSVEDHPRGRALLVVTHHTVLVHQSTRSGSGSGSRPRTYGLRPGNGPRQKAHNKEG